MQVKNSSAVPASIRALQNSSSMSITIMRERISKWVSPPSLGAAIMKNRVEGWASGAL